MWIRSFFKQWLAWLSDATAYLKFANRPLKSALLIILLNLTLLSLPDVYIWINNTVPMMASTFKVELGKSEQFYPQDLEISWDGSQVALTPYQILTIPNPWSTVTSLPDTLLLVNTKIENIEAFTGAETPLFILSANKLWTNDLSGNWSELNLSELENILSSFTITSSNYSEYVAKWINWTSVSIPYLQVLGILIIPLSIVLFFLLVLIDTVMVYFLLKVFGSKVNFKKVFLLCFQVGVVAQFLSTITYFLYPETNVDVMALSFWSILTFILFFKQVRELSW